MLRMMSKVAHLAILKDCKIPIKKEYTILEKLMHCKKKKNKVESECQNRGNIPGSRNGFTGTFTFRRLHMKKKKSLKESTW